MVTTTLRQLLEAGVHFGHQTGRWNPKMKPFIFAKRNGIYIIDLQRTRSAWQEALEFLEQEAAQGGKVLFVGTKRQAQSIIAEEAQRCGQFYVKHRWLGGLLTNWQTISKSIDRYRDLEAMSEDGRFELLPKKEVLQLNREMEKLERNLIGIKDMGGLPDVVFVIDIRRERIAVDEALKLGIPVVAIVDTNCDPEGIDYVVPGNDDAIRAIRLFCRAAADAIGEGAQVYEARVAEAEKARAEKAKAAKEAAEADRKAAEARKKAAQGGKKSDDKPARDKGSKAQAKKAEADKKAAADAKKAEADKKAAAEAKKAAADEKAEAAAAEEAEAAEESAPESNDDEDAAGGDASSEEE